MNRKMHRKCAIAAGTSVFVGVGGNLPCPHHGPPPLVFEAALAAMAADGIVVIRRSRWYRSPPWPASDQPEYVNGVLELAPLLPPERLLDALHGIEARFGRVRGVPNAARILDLDLLAYGALVRTDTACPVLPHPRLHERAFVLRPLADLAPAWRHPVLSVSIGTLIERLAADQWAEPIEAERDPPRR